MRKFTKLLAAAVLLTGVASPAMTVSANAAGFSDLNQADAWAQAGILKAKELGYITGDTTGHFHPLANITRQEAASIFARLLKRDATGFAKSSFSDVSPTLWSFAQIEAVKAAGLMIGDEGKFRPHDAITREELAILLVKAAGIDATGKGSSLNFADNDAISPWAKDAVAAAYLNGLMVGSDNKFNPQRATTRQEVAVVAVNFAASLKATVENVTDGTVTINGMTYQTGDAVKGIFTSKNKTILHGAGIKFRADGTTLTEVTALEITASGKPAAEGAAEFSSNLVLDGAGAAVKGTLTVSGNYITLQNLTLEGDLVIGQELQNDFYSNGLTVKGKTVINGGDTNTVVFNNASLGAVNVNKPNVRMEAKGKSTIGEMTVTNDATIHADNGVTIPKLTVGTGAKQVEIDAPVGTLDVQNATAKLNVKKPIDKLQLPEGVTIGDLIENFDRVKDLLKEVLIGNTPATPKPAEPNAPSTPAPVSSLPNEADFTLVNFGEGADLLMGEAPLGTAVKVYDAPTGGHLIGSAYAQEGGIFTAVPLLTEDGEPLGHYQMMLNGGFPEGSSNIYVTYTETGKRESQRIAVATPAVPNAPAAEDIHVYNRVDEDYLTVDHVQPGQMVYVFDSAVSRHPVMAASNGEPEPGSVVINLDELFSSDFDELTHVYVAVGAEGEDGPEVEMGPTRFAVSSFVEMQVPTEIPAEMEIHPINYANGSDYIHATYAPEGWTVTAYDEAGELIGSAVSENTFEDQFGDTRFYANLELEEGMTGSAIYLTLTEPGKGESEPIEHAVPSIPNAPVADDIEVINNPSGDDTVIVENAPAGARIFIYDKTTVGDNLAIAVGEADGTGRAEVTVLDGFTEGVTTAYVASFIDGAESDRVEVSIPEVSATPLADDVEVFNIADPDDYVDVFAPLGAIIRLYDAQGNELKSTVSQGADMPKGTLRFEAGYGDLTDLYVTVQEMGKAESAKLEVEVPAVQVTSDPGDPITG